MHKERVIEVILAQPRGFCAGVKRAIDATELALQKYGDRHKIYVLHEIVHNNYIVNNLKKQGVIFIDTVEEAQENSILIFSAHGVAKEIEEKARKKNLYVIDATCPLVSKVHNEARKYEREGFQVVLIGHKNHPEVVGTTGRINQNMIVIEKLEDVYQLRINDSNKLAYITQTTLSMDDTSKIISALKERFSNIVGPNLRDICYATQNRQNAVKELSKLVDIVIIVGSKNSSNSNRLLDLVQKQGIPSFLIGSYHDLDLRWFKDAKKIGITAGASAPEVLIDQLISYLREYMKIKVSLMEGIVENIKFRLPKALEYGVLSKV